MYPLTFDQVASIFGQTSQNHSLISQVIIDSREAKPNCLFFALPGANVDGHRFVRDVLDLNGFAVVKTGQFSDSREHIIQVQDPLLALQKLAQEQLARMALPVVAITGSNGKTTTKDLTAAVLGQKMGVYKTPGNYNNELGVPLTILNIDKQHQIVVLEMGMRGLGQISGLTQIAPPDIGVITNVYPVHLELLGSMENIARAKLELLQGLKPKGVAIINGDDQLLRRGLAQLNFSGKIITYGKDKSNDLWADQVEFDRDGNVRFQCSFKSQREQVALDIPGAHNVYNSLAALAVGLEMGITLKEGVLGLRQAQLSQMRLEIRIGANQVKIINDSYNASPASMKHALDILGIMKTDGNRVAILGDMLELGKISEPAHMQLGEQAASVCDLLICVGKYGDLIRYGAETAGLKPEEIKVYQDVSHLLREIKKLVQPYDLILVKASRSVALEHVVEALIRR